MTVEGEFILLMCADTYLTNDFEFSLRISTTDFSFVACTRFFEGNILRYRALASLKLFENRINDEESREESFELLTTAIASLQNAYQIFKADDV